MRPVEERECGFLMVPRHTLDRLLRTAGVGVVAMMLAVTPAAHAWADPSVQELEKQIEVAWNALEPVIEQYNEVHSQLKANQAKAAELQKRIQPLQQQVDEAMARVSAMAVQVYKGGAALKFNALLNGGSPSALAEQLAMLNQLAISQRRQISAVA